MTTSIDGSLLTKARHARGDVIITPGSRGGIEFKTLSYLDALLEADVISDVQRDYAACYWSLREAAFWFLGARIGNYGEPEPDEADQPTPEIDSFAEDSASTEIFMELARRLPERHRKILNASCQSIPAAGREQKLALVWAFGEGAIRSAFDSLEHIFPIAKEAALARIESEKKRLSCGAASLPACADAANV